MTLRELMIQLEPLDRSQRQIDVTVKQYLATRDYLPQFLLRPRRPRR